MGTDPRAAAARRPPGRDRRRVLAAALLAALSGPALAGADQKATEVSDRLTEAMGGRERFDAARLLHFEWAVEVDGETRTSRRHWWDKHTGQYRLEMLDAESGEPVVAVLDTDTRQGAVQLGERTLQGDELSSWLERAYGAFINDSYWLLMPWKWLDPGTHATYDGSREVDGADCDVVRLAFDAGVGLTSNDRYWAFVDRGSNLLAGWEYVLQQEDGSPGTAAPTRWRWSGWVSTEAGVRFATERRREGGEQAVRIYFPVVELRPELTDEEARSLFTLAAPAR